MTEQEIERCLERFTMGKTCDVMNFDYAGTLAYLQRLKSENAALRQGKKAAVEDVAERIKMAFYYEFDELIPSIMADKIDELVKEVCGDEPNDDRLR